MVKESEAGGEVEWRINMPDGTSKVLVGEKSRIVAWKLWGFLDKAWKIGVNDPRKVMHCVKVGMALCFISLFYYMRPLYEGVGGTAMWAVMTVVVVFEYTVGACLCKCVNRASGTLLAGALGIGVHWIASQSGERFEPIILQVSVFLLAAAATFSRFIPWIKARFDYGAMIFILTFSLVSVSGYRVEKLFEMAHHRLSTIAIGTSICIITSILLWPVWAGTELHNLVTNNMDKLSDSLDGCVAQYFSNTKTEKSILQGYKCALNSKATEESLANFARWEPAHGGFNFGHPWKEYCNIGVSLRSAACCIEALNTTIASNPKTPHILNNHFSKFCLGLTAKSSAVLKQLVVSISTMQKSPRIHFMIQEMRSAVEQLENAMTKQPIHFQSTTLLDLLPLLTISSLLIEIAARTEKIAEAVDGLAQKAEFKVPSVEEIKRSQNS